MHAEPWSDEPESAAVSAPLPFVLAEDPTRATDRSATRALEVVQVFGDSILAVRHLSAGQSLVLGRDLVVADEFVTGVPIAQHDGEAWVVSCTGGRLIHRIDGRPVSGDVRLGDDDQLVVELGAVTLVFREVWRSRRVPVPVGQDVDVPFAIVAGMVGAMAAMVGWIGGLLPEVDRTVSRNDDIEHIVHIFQQREITPPPARVRHAESGSSAAGGGSPAPLRRVHRDEPQGGQPKPVGILAALQDDAVSAIFGNSALPGSIQQGIAGMHGATSGMQGGLGLGGRCQGDNCLGMGPGIGDSVGVETYGRGRKYGDPGPGDGHKTTGHIADTGEPIMIGNVDRADIDRIVKKNLTRIRHCYQRELQKTPDLGGKVKVKFVIGSDGTVKSAVTSTTTLGSPAAENCINHVFDTMVFPEPKGGGTAIVSYPFLFAPG